MSKFYSKYCESLNIGTVEHKPNWLIAEEKANERHKQHINQAKVITTTKHVGSKNYHKLAYNAKHVHSKAQSILKRYGLL